MQSILDVLGCEAWWDLEAAERITKAALGEDTLSDVLLLRLAERAADAGLDVRVRRYTKDQEGRLSRAAAGAEPATGADYEVFAGGGTSWVGLRVQAKRLDTDTLQYNAAASAEEFADQLLVLRTDAAREPGRPRVPVVAFYNYWPLSAGGAAASPSVPGSACGYATATPPLQGWTALDAEAVLRPVLNDLLALYLRRLRAALAGRPTPRGINVGALQRYGGAAHPIGCLLAEPGFGCNDASLGVSETTDYARAVCTRVVAGRHPGDPAQTAQVVSSLLMPTLPAYAQAIPPTPPRPHGGPAEAGQRDDPAERPAEDAGDRDTDPPPGVRNVTVARFATVGAPAQPADHGPVVR